MKLNKNSVLYVVGFVALVTLICSLIVSSVAVSLSKRQTDELNKSFQSAVLNVAKIQANSDDVLKVFQKDIETRYVDVTTGNWADENEVKDIGNNYSDIFQLSKYKKYLLDLDHNDNIAGLTGNQYARIQQVFLVKDESGNVTQLILPFYGNGLWSVMYGLLAVDTDGNTVKNVIWYKQGETPGLGGEVENPNFTKQFEGKEIYNLNSENPNEPLLMLAKSVNVGDKYKVNALSGATLTSNGVSNTLQFWLGNLGFSKFLHNVQTGEVKLNEQK